MMKYAFYLSLKTFFLKICKFLFCLFGHEGKRLDKGAKVNLKIYVVIYLEKTNYNTHVAQYLKK